MTVCEELASFYAGRAADERDPAVAAQFAVAASIAAAAALFAHELRLGLDHSRAVDAIDNLADALGAASR